MGLLAPPPPPPPRNALLAATPPPNTPTHPHATPPQIALLAATLVVGHLLAKRRVLWIGEAGVALLLGLSVGLLILLSPLLDAHSTCGGPSVGV